MCHQTINWVTVRRHSQVSTDDAKEPYLITGVVYNRWLPWIAYGVASIAKCRTTTTANLRDRIVRCLPRACALTDRGSLAGCGNVNKARRCRSFMQTKLGRLASQICLFTAATSHLNRWIHSRRCDRRAVLDICAQCKLSWVPSDWPPILRISGRIAEFDGKFS